MTTHRQKPIILFFTKLITILNFDFTNLLSLCITDFFVHFAGTFWLSIYKNGDWFFVHPIPEGQKQISF